MRLGRNNIVDLDIIDIVKVGKPSSIGKGSLGVN
jgi:hypothetical protein